jgi:hypothetical protein
MDLVKMFSPRPFPAPDKKADGPIARDSPTGVAREKNRWPEAREKSRWPDSPPEKKVYSRLKVSRFC